MTEAEIAEAEIAEAEIAEAEIAEIVVGDWNGRDVLVRREKGEWWVVLSEEYVRYGDGQRWILLGEEYVRGFWLKSQAIRLAKFMANTRSY